MTALHTLFSRKEEERGKYGIVIAETRLRYPRSPRSGLSRSIKATFQARRHFFNAFSASIAETGSPNS